jgi:Xaa-Pro dipeptidase
VYHRVEQPTFRALQAGDLLALEIEGRWGGYVAQIDETLSVGPAHPNLRDGMHLACEAFNRVFEQLRPGARLADLIAAGRVTGMGGRGRTGLGIHGRGTGEDGPLVVGEIMEGGRMSGRQGRAFVLAGGPAPPELESIEIQEGCCFVVKPSAAVDGKPDFGRWGETVAVTATGAERLGTRPQVLHELI